MLFPIGDENKGISGPAYITHLFLLVNIGVFIVQVMYPEITYGWSLVPRQITTGEDLTQPIPITIDGRIIEIPMAPSPSPIYITLLTAMFMHGSIAHLFGNMLFLWIFGDNVEHRFGHLPFALFYVLSGVVGSLAQIALDPQSVIPNLGASGAISGVLGAYLVLFPKNRVHAVFLFHIISIPAIVAIGIWILFQLVAGYGQIFLAEETVGGVAYAAHIGGFFAGALLALIVRVIVGRERESVITRGSTRDPHARTLW